MTELTSASAADVVRAAIVEIAPDVEAEIGDLDDQADVFDALGLDSMDHLNVMEALARQTGVEIPEREYGALRSIDAIGRYLATAGN